MHVTQLCGIIPQSPPPAPIEGVTVQEFQFAEFTLNKSSYRLQRGTRAVRLEKLPMELLILLLERHGELVSREEIAGRLWGQDVYVDVDHGINTAVRKVRQVLRDDPEKPRFVETVVGKGYRFTAPVMQAESTAAESPEDPTEAVPPLEAPSTQKSRMSMGRGAWIAGATLAAVLAVVLPAFVRRSAAPAAQHGVRSLAVLPLKNFSGDKNQDYLAEGMTEALIDRLAQIHHLRVISHTSVMRFKNSQLSAPEIAKQLGVDALVEGSVARDGNHIRVSAQLIRAASDDHFWSESYDRELKDALSLESDVAQTIAEKVEVTITGQERQRLRAARPVSPEAYEDYLQGLFELERGNSKASIDKSIRYFQAAVAQDPTFAPAYVGLGTSYSMLGSTFVGEPPDVAIQREESAARKALELDPNLSDAHDLLAEVAQDRWRWSEAQAEYNRALELNPNDALAHGGLAWWFLSQGQADQALAWAERARELDPLVVQGQELGWMLFEARRYDEAERELRSALAVQPDNAPALWDLGVVLLDEKQVGQAIPVLEEAATLSDGSPGVKGALIRAYAQGGRRREALRLLAELQRRRKAGFVPAGAFVNAYLGLGDKDEAFAWLDQGYKDHSNSLQFLKVDPVFDPLRGDPRFADLLRRVGLN